MHVSGGYIYFTYISLIFFIWIIKLFIDNLKTIQFFFVCVSWNLDSSGYKLMLNATFNNDSIISWPSVIYIYWSRNPEKQHRTTNLPQVICRFYNINIVWSTYDNFTGRRGRSRMVVRFTMTYKQSMAITTNVVSLNPAHGEVYSIQHYVVKFFSDLQQVGGLFRVLRIRFPPLIKLTDKI
jgi:hypothetical protein